MTDVSFQCVAIILPVFNASKTIERAIESIIHQTYQNFVLYVIDDCSTDNSLEKINKYSYDPRLVILENKVNKGVSYSRNYGLDYSNEPIIAYIDSDDQWHPNKLAEQVDCYLSNGRVPIITAYNYIHSAKKTISHNSDTLDLKSFLKKDYRICLSSLLHGRVSFRFIETGHEDYLFIYKLFSDFGHLQIINHPLVNYYAVAGSLSSNKILAARWQMNLLINYFELPVHKAIYFFYYYVVNAIKFKVGDKNGK